MSFTSAFYDNRGEEIASIAHMYSIGSFSYTHLWKHTSLTAGVNYKGTDGYQGFGVYESGGSGIEAWAEISQDLKHGWNVTVSGAYGTKYFNKAGGNLSFSAALKKGWTLGVKAAYRLTPPVFVYDKNKNWDGDYKKRNVTMLGPRISKEWDKVGLHINADLITLDLLSNIYYNVNLRGKFFINDDGVSSVAASAGFGSFPELAFFDQTTMNGITNMNAMVGIDGAYLLTKNLILTLAGAWNTYYNPIFTADGYPLDSYRNIYSVSLGLQVAF